MPLQVGVGLEMVYKLAQFHACITLLQFCFLMVGQAEW